MNTQANSPQSGAHPSLNQMRARMLTIHRDALRNAAAGRPLMCGRTAQNTLLKWGAIANGQITALGRELLGSDA